MTADDIIDDIIRREGNAYTNDPVDRGGPTKYGITQRTLAEYRNRPVSPEEVASLTAQEARDIYLKRYVRPFERIGLIGHLLALLVDCAVNSGVQRAIRWLQQAAGLVSDGVIGPKTQHAANTQHWRKLYVGVLAQRYAHYASLAAGNTGQNKFIRGWVNRANEFLKALV